MMSFCGKWIGVSGFIFLLAGCSLFEPKPQMLTDQPLEAYRRELIEVAFGAATAIPVKPLIKDRSREQAKVVEAALEMHQPVLAVEFVDQIPNWRRGKGYADCAFYSVEQGVTNKVASYLDLAEKISQTADQDWRRDRIVTRIAQTRLLLGQAVDSEVVSDESERGKLEQVEAQLCDDEHLSGQVETLSSLVASGNFDFIKNGLYAYVHLYERFYDNEVHREELARSIRASWVKLPYNLRVDLLMKMAEISLDHEDVLTSQAIVAEANEILSLQNWRAEFVIPLMAGVAELRYRSGETEDAVADIQATLALYDDHFSEIINMYRVDALVPIAEAFWVAGQAESARAVYMKALEASMVNPNSRPRVEDVSIICLSMALHECEPGAVLWAQLREVKSSLGDPW